MDEPSIQGSKSARSITLVIGFSCGNRGFITVVGDSLANQRILNFERREPGEIPIRGPQLGDSVLQAEGGDPRIVDARAGDARRAK